MYPVEVVSSLVMVSQRPLFAELLLTLLPRMHLLRYIMISSVYDLELIRFSLPRTDSEARATERVSVRTAYIALSLSFLVAGISVLLKIGYTRPKPFSVSSSQRATFEPNHSYQI